LKILFLSKVSEIQTTCISGDSRLKTVLENGGTGDFVRLWFKSWFNTEFFTLIIKNFCS